MKNVFGESYANAYDILYHDKDYEAECDLIERIFREYTSQPVRRVLDLGCGTGNHAIRLAKRSYEVTGVDRSDTMLHCAEHKAQQKGITVRLLLSAIKDLELKENFDAALMMFAVLSYHVENHEVVDALRAARQHLLEGGLLVFDVWYGPAVLTQRPGERVRVIEAGNETTLRATDGKLNTLNHTCQVSYRLWRLNDNQPTTYTTETHLMRYFFPKELELFLEVSGFELLHLGSFPNIERNPDESTWNIIVVAKAR
jgi:SAM-dependent methyltransferase